MSLIQKLIVDGNILTGRFNMNKRNVFIGYFEIDKVVELLFDKKVTTRFIENDFKKDVHVIESILSQDEISALLKCQQENPTIPVGIDGIAKHYQEGDKIHSYRSTFYSETIAQSLFERIKNKIEPIISVYENTSDCFEPIGLNPAFRFIDYTQHGFLVPHYDFPYKQDDDNLTLMSLVLYLTDSHDGKTRYIREHRVNDYSDWTRQALQEEILFEVNPKAGNALLFPHQLLHDSEEVLSNKIILRTDVLFKRISK